MEGFLVQYAGEAMSSAVMALLAFVAYKVKLRDKDYRVMCNKVTEQESIVKVSNAEFTIKIASLEKRQEKLQDFIERFIMGAKQ